MKVCDASRQINMILNECKCGSLNVGGPHNVTGNGTIRRCGRRNFKAAYCRRCIVVTKVNSNDDI